MIGSSVSGVDISRDIANVTKEVHVSSRSTTPETYEKLPGYDNLWLHSTVRIKFIINLIYLIKSNPEDYFLSTCIAD